MSLERLAEKTWSSEHFHIQALVTKAVLFSQTCQSGFPYRQALFFRVCVFNTLLIPMSSWPSELECKMKRALNFDQDFVAMTILILFLIFTIIFNLLHRKIKINEICTGYFSKLVRYTIGVRVFILQALPYEKQPNLNLKNLMRQNRILIYYICTV